MNKEVMAPKRKERLIIKGVYLGKVHDPYILEVLELDKIDTHSSTYSKYFEKLLHDHYVTKGLGKYSNGVFQYSAKQVAKLRKRVKVKRLQLS